MRQETSEGPVERIKGRAASIGSERQRGLLAALRERSQTVSELVVVTGQPQVAVSKDLKILRDRGLVTGEARGRFRVYRITPDGRKVLRAVGIVS